MANESIFVHVTRVQIPAMSSLGYGEGWTERDGSIFQVWFTGDHRLMRDLGEAVLLWAHGSLEDTPIAEVPTWAIVRTQLQAGGQA